MFQSLPPLVKQWLCLSWIIVAPVLHPMFIHAAERQAKDYGTFTIYFENDTFFDSDYLYTNGFKQSWTSEDLENYRDRPGAGAWAHSLIANQPFSVDQEDSHFVSFSFGQNIYTPEDTESSEVVEDERPYAGLLYFSLGYSARSRKRSHTWEVMLGVVGPSSYAEDTQGAIHDLLDQDKPQGWDNQLDDEPVLNLFYEHKWKALRTRQLAGLGFDLNTNFGAALGNLYIGALGGAQLRLGWRLPNDFGTSVIRPGSDTNAPRNKNDPRFNKPFNRFCVHVFCGVEGIYMIRNMTLDGNTFASSHSVEKEPLVGTLSIGIGFTLHRFKISMAHVYSSKVYKSQSGNSEWGSITLSYIY